MNNSIIGAAFYLGVLVGMALMIIWEVLIDFLGGYVKKRLAACLESKERAMSEKTLQDELREDYCTCHDGYKCRGLQDPMCESCNNKESRERVADELDRLAALDRDLAEMRRERDELASVLRDITQIAPLGVDTYPECYRRIQCLARDALTPKEPNP